jgi:hypothetical protein
LVVEKDVGALGLNAKAEFARRRKRAAMNFMVSRMLAAQVRAIGINKTQREVFLIWYLESEKEEHANGNPGRCIVKLRHVKKPEMCTTQGYLLYGYHRCSVQYGCRYQVHVLYDTPPLLK